MKDKFFAAEPKKRPKKRPASAAGAADSDSASAATKAKRSRSNPAVSSSSSALKAKPKPSKRAAAADADISGSDSDPEADNVGDGIDIDRTVYSKDDEDSADEDGNRESAAEKRLRLAKAYLDQVKGAAARKAGFEGDDLDAEEMDRDLIAERLRDDALESRGRLWRTLASQYLHTLPIEPTKFPRGHQQSLTCLAVSPNRAYVFSGSKDGSIIQWNAATKRKERTLLGLVKSAPADLAAKGHTRDVLCLAANGQYLVSGGNDHKLNVWAMPNLDHVRQFNSHRDAVTGCVIRKGTPHLYTSSRDRTVKTWNLDEMTYVETLFGHQDPVAAIDTVNKEHCVTAGGRDKTMRLWKIVEESQLLFRASHFHGSLDVVWQVTEDLFVSGDDHGHISLWHTGKKKAVFTIHHAHGYVPQSEQDVELGLPRKPYWITALAGIKFADIMFSGSWSGEIKAWRIDRVAQKIVAVGTLPVVGCVNALTVVEPVSFPAAFENAEQAEVAKVDRMSQDPEHAIVVYAGVGQEHRDGRWWRVKEARNTVYEFVLRPKVPKLSEAKKKQTLIRSAIAGEADDADADDGEFAW
ncbi:WD40-repeat-containing domain protein [Catenaria anguillulae PL171]|uniref:WD40-repeat-containing domain protein n=1 Tax=Catenaria anguillulae PL171 TaxID=765915 RepID=A0A1Y2HC37_9FUNG|nr:WD40-repeat-containing domain protein [Catenaria anguillulae PL171]